MSEDNDKDGLLSVTLPDGVTLEQIKAVDAEALRQSMIQGIYLTEMFLFTQASKEAAHMEKTRQVIGVLSDSLFNEERMAMDATEGGYTIDTKIDLLKLANDMHQQKLKFLSEVHKSVASGMETLKTIERSKPRSSGRSGSVADRQVVRETRRKLEDKMAQRVREIESKNNSSGE